MIGGTEARSIRANTIDYRLLMDKLNGSGVKFKKYSIISSSFVLAIFRVAFYSSFKVFSFLFSFSLTKLTIGITIYCKLSAINHRIKHFLFIVRQSAHFHMN